MSHELPNGGILSVPVNTAGRDFFVGDIQGGRAPLEALLDFIHFNHATDRLFSVGDLIDRGSGSYLVLKEFMKQNSFYNVMGNHEAMMLMTFGKIGNPVVEDVWMGNGGRWSGSLSAAQKQELLDFASKMPLVIEVPLANGKKIGVLHAEMPVGSHWNDLAHLNVDVDDAIDATYNISASLLWGRQRGTSTAKLISNPKAKATKESSRDKTFRATSPVPGIDLIVCGHEIMEDPASPRKSGNTLFIDTGCSKPSGRGRLTAWCPQVNQYWQVGDHELASRCKTYGPFPTPETLDNQAYAPIPNHSEGYHGGHPISKKPQAKP